MTLLKAAWLVLVSAAAVGLSHVFMGADGTKGALLGLGVGALLCLVNFFIMSRVRKAEGQKLKLVMVGSIASFVLLIAFILLVRYLAPAFVRPAALTALALYLAYRAADVVALGRPTGIVAGRSPLLTSVEADSAKEAR